MENIYRHYKERTDESGNQMNLYQIIAVASNSENLRKEVVYRALYGDGAIWVRPYDMFFEDVELANGEKCPRFKKVESERVLDEIPLSLRTQYAFPGIECGAKK